LATLPIEFPVSTIIMLRSIAEIARNEGEDPSDPEAALSCIQVFALGGRAGSNDASESGYFAVRGMLAKSVSEAARFVAERGLVEEGAPIVVRFISQVASRFGVVLTQKVRCASPSSCRRIRWRFRELLIYRAFPGDSTRSFHCAQARKGVWMVVQIE
jgi:hypothetical protein